MKLLIVTQKVDRNDSVLGFFHRWIQEFAKHVEFVTVICLYKGEYDLPANVKVLSLGKETGVSRFKYISRFYRYIWRERKNYDSVFVHMNPVYVNLGAVVWKFLKKKTALWYTHKNVDIKLRVAEKLADIIFSASKESFRLASKKLVITGHGLDIGHFREIKKSSNDTGPIKMLSVGRISKVKNMEVLIDVARILKGDGIEFSLRLAGEGDPEYVGALKERVGSLGLANEVIFLGPVNYETLPDIYSGADIFINLSDTGSMDKAVLEAMACGLEIITSNQAFKSIVEKSRFVSTDPSEIAYKVRLSARKRNEFTKYIQENHNLESLLNKIVAYL